MDKKVIFEENGMVVTTRKFTRPSRTVSLAGFWEAKVAEKKLGLPRHLEEAIFGRDRFRVTVDLIGPAGRLRCVEESFTYKGTPEERRLAYQADPERLLLMRAANALVNAVSVARWDIDPSQLASSPRAPSCSAPQGSPR
jgi:hypothetical protein